MNHLQYFLTTSRPASGLPGGVFSLLLFLIFIGSASSGQAQDAPDGDAAGQNATTQGAEAEEAVTPEEIQLSFTGTNIDTIIKWLAEQTGKSIVKHPQVKCSLTIISPKKLPRRQAINLIYDALALEGFSAAETNEHIIIVPEAMEPKIRPELASGSMVSPLGGRQRVVKVFTLEHVSAGQMKDKVRGVLSEKVQLDVDEHSNKLIVTDYAENVWLLSELIKELDVSTVADSVVEIINLKHSEAGELATLLQAVLNDPSAGKSAAAPKKPTPPKPGTPTPPGGASSGSSQQVRVWADKYSNRLIVAAPQKRIPEIRTLIALLDTEKPADVAVRVIALVHVDAGDLVEEIAPMYQKMSSTSLKDIIEITSNSRSNSMIVLSSESNYNAIKELVALLDTKDAQEKTTRPFTLQNADAQDVAEQLQDLYSDDSNSYSRYNFYYGYGSGNQQGKVRFVADRRRNTVIVQGPPGVMDSIGEMIAALDEPVDEEALAPRIYPLKYVDAWEIQNVLDELFMKRDQTRNYWDYEPEVDRDVGRLYGKVRITSESFTNSIIVTANSEEYLQAVEDVLKKLDVPPETGDTTLTLKLKFAKAVNLANNINILFARGGSPGRQQSSQQRQPNPQGRQPAQSGAAPTSFELEEEQEESTYFPWLGGPQDTYRSADGRTTMRPVSELVGRVRVVPDSRTNSLLITTNAHFFSQVLKVVNDLDVPTPQVLLEAKIIEVAGDFRERLGVRWSPDGSQVFDTEDLDNSIIAVTSVEYHRMFAGALSDSLRTGVLDSTISLDFLVQFLKKTIDARLLAEPQINVADNERGRLFVGSRVPFITGSLNTVEGGRNDSFEYIDVGIILDVTPHINSDDEVALKVRVESSKIREGETLFGGAILDTRNYLTDLVVKNNQTLVLGGIIRRDEVVVERKIPFLGSIPFLGWLFKKRDTEHLDVELMVFLRPTVTRSPAEVEKLMQDIHRRTPRIQEWQESLDLEQAEKSGEVDEPPSE